MRSGAGLIYPRRNAGYAPISIDSGGRLRTEEMCRYGSDSVDTSSGEFAFLGIASAEGATAPETLRQTDRDVIGTLESVLGLGGAKPPKGKALAAVFSAIAKLSGFPTEGAV